MQARQFKIAEDILQQGLAIRPHDVQLHLLMAYLHQQWERYPVARQFASSAIGIAPDHGAGYLALAWAIVCDHQYTPNRNDPWARFDELKSTRLEEQRLEIGEHLCHAALQCDPDDPDAYCLLAQLAMIRERFDEAIRFAHRGLSIDIQHSGCHQVEIECLRKAGQTDQAMQSAYKRLEQSPEDDAIHRELASMQMASKDFDQALLHARQAVEIAPDNSANRQLYRDVLKSQSRWLRPIVHIQFFAARARRMLSRHPVFWTVSAMIAMLLTGWALKTLGSESIGIPVVVLALLLGLIFSERPLMGLVDLWLMRKREFRIMLDPEQVYKHAAVHLGMGLVYLCMLSLVAFQNWRVPAFGFAGLLLVAQIVSAVLSKSRGARIVYLLIFALLAGLLFHSVSGLVNSTGQRSLQFVYAIELTCFAMLGILAPCFLIRSQLDTAKGA